MQHWQLSQLYDPPCILPLPLPCAPPSVTLSNPLSFFICYLFPSFFMRCHHPIQPAVYDPVLNEGTLGAVPAMLDRLMVIHTSQHYHRQSITLFHNVLRLFRDSFCIFWIFRFIWFFVTSNHAQTRFSETAVTPTTNINKFNVLQIPSLVQCISR